MGTKAQNNHVRQLEINLSALIQVVRRECESGDVLPIAKMRLTQAADQAEAALKGDHS